jgi:tRNA splicing ligase
MKNDPHIIDYPTSQVFLLDVVYNDIKFKKYEYNDVCFVANSFGLKHKEKAYELANWQEFFDWYYEVTDENYEYNGRNIEGFVVEDANGYMVKLKLTYYNFWKFMRSISHETLKKGYITRTSALTTSLANEYYGWVKSLYNIEDKESLPKDICTLRKMFYDNKTK